MSTTYLYRVDGPVKEMVYRDPSNHQKLLSVRTRSDGLVEVICWVPEAVALASSFLPKSWIEVSVST